MKHLFLAIILGMSATANAAGDSNFSIGIGSDHGGIGAKYSMNEGKDKFFGSLGLLSYVESSGAAVGYGIGWERMMSTGNHGIGLLVGAVDSKHLGDEIATYHGASAFYNYYFSGFNDKSFVIGACVFSGATSSDEIYFESSRSGVDIKLAYQW